MSELTHTQEPWATAYRERKDGNWSQEIFDGDGETIAALAWYPIRDGSTVHTDRVSLTGTVPPSRVTVVKPESGPRGGGGWVTC